MCRIHWAFITPAPHLPPCPLAKQLRSQRSGSPHLHPLDLLQGPSQDIAPSSSLDEGVMDRDNTGKSSHPFAVGCGGHRGMDPPYTQDRMGKAGDLLNPLEGGFRACRTCLVRRKLFSGGLNNFQLQFLMLPIPLHFTEPPFQPPA